MMTKAVYGNIVIFLEKKKQEKNKKRLLSLTMDDKPNTL
jgi:hypothetical protein